MKKIFFYIILSFLLSCEKHEEDLSAPVLLAVEVGDVEVSLSAPFSENLPVDRGIVITFSSPIDPSSVGAGIDLSTDDTPVDFTANLLAGNASIVVRPVGPLMENSFYKILISREITGINGKAFQGQEVYFKTRAGNLRVTAFTIEGSEEIIAGRIVNVPLDLELNLQFSHEVDPQTFVDAVTLSGKEVPGLKFNFSEDFKGVSVSGDRPLRALAKYELEISDVLTGESGEEFEGFEQVFFSEADAIPKFPIISQEALLDKVQAQTFRYFWDFAHENSGMARERNTSGNLVTVGGSGFGVMAILVGIHRGWISRPEGLERLEKIISFLEGADRFHGAWPHWLNGNSGEVIPFSDKDDGGDLVETALMIQGLLTAKAYLNEGLPVEQSLRNRITQLWYEVEWEWYTKEGEEVLYWHWSPEHAWDMNLPIRGYNEALIVYILAAASPTHPIDKSVYDIGWARSGAIVNGQSFYNIRLPLGYDYGGPLFFAHYSFLGLDPRNLEDQYANYWEQNRHHSLINQRHCIYNPLGYVAYGENCWGLTASDDEEGYSVHSPLYDLGVITPTAALSSLPYTPEASLAALEFFYYQLGDRLWGEYGFHDAFNVTQEWYADSYLAIDQGPILLMIENYRSGLLWDTFMKDEDIIDGLEKLDFNY